MIQRNGTAWIGSVFGPVMLIWFVVAGVLGIVGIARTPAVLAALNAGEAMDTMPVGARMLTIRSEACAPNEVIIAVEDSGPGIDPKDVDRVFDPFFTTKSQGMGMGLSICRSIIEAHHGQLSASPGITRGAVFQIALPSNK